jgi:tRNA/rRNA methyltransferase
MNNIFDRIHVVLVRPQSSKNIGAVCRAMKTMSIHRLSIIGSKDINPLEVKHLAIHGYDVFEKAFFSPNLIDALPDMTFIAGISRRRGKMRKYFALSPEELAEKVAQTRGKTALIFGNEESGLTQEELSHCHVAVKIPSSRAFPSLNLSHAVQIITYQLFRTLSASSFPRYTPINQAKLASLTGIIRRSLKNIGFFSQGEPEDLELFFKDILARAQLSGREAARLEVVFRKISGLIAKKGIES